MKTRNTLLLLVLFLTISTWACKDDDSGSPKENAYERCCEVQAVKIFVGEEEVYIPNIFTPNDDGFNDRFAVFYSQDFSNSQDTLKIENIEIKDLNGKTLFSQDVFLSNNFAQPWWLNEDLGVKGLFNYSMMLQSPDGAEVTVNGSACSYLCKTDADSILVENISNCQFGTQHNGKGGHDPLAPSLEPSECF